MPDHEPHSNLETNIMANLKKLKEHLNEAQAKYKMYADRLREDLELNPGDQVLLSSKHLQSERPCKKLDFRKIGPFKVLKKIGKVSYRLQLPTSMRIHDTFHVSLLEPVIKNETLKNEDMQQHNQEEVLDSRNYYMNGQYLVKKSSEHLSQARWVPCDAFRSSLSMLAYFHRQYP